MGYDTVMAPKNSGHRRGRAGIGYVKRKGSPGQPPASPGAYPAPHAGRPHAVSRSDGDDPEDRRTKIAARRGTAPGGRQQISKPTVQGLTWVVMTSTAS